MNVKQARPIEKALRTEWLLFFLFSSFYLISLGSKPGYTVDSREAYLLAWSIVEFGDFLPTFGVHRGYLHGVVFGPFCLLGVWLSKLLKANPHVLTRHLFCVMNTGITALTATILFSFLKRIRLSFQTALFTAFSFGLTTLAWPYARYEYSNPLGALLLLGATGITLSSLVAGNGTPRTVRNLFIASFLLGSTLFCRTELFVLFPVFAGGFWLALEGQSKRPVKLLTVVFPSLFLLALLFLYNFHYWGAPVKGGYKTTGFQLSPSGLLGLLLSPGRGLLVFCPVLALSIPGWYFISRHSKTQAVFLLLTAGPLYCLYGFWKFWWGGWSWGPRFLLPVIPILCFPLACFLEHTRSAHNSKIKAALYSLFLLLSLVGLLFQFVGVALDFNDYILNCQRNGVSEPDLISSWHYFPITGHIRMLALLPMKNWDFIWFKITVSDPWTAIIPVVLVTVFGSSLCLLVAQWVQWRKEKCQQD